MPRIEESQQIKGVYQVTLEAYADDRGRFMETFRKEWFPQRRWDVIQSNRSDSKAGVLRGLHYHHRQVDYWYVVAGRVRAGLADLRPDSPTFKATETVEMGGERRERGNEIGLFIPVGVAHGFVALTEATLLYVVDNYYNGGADENGVAWDDPELNVDWGVTRPVVSDRDACNPYLRDIPSEQLPRLTR